MRNVAIVGMLVLWAGLCYGQQTSGQKAPAAEKTLSPSEAADHIRQAAAHLEAAGMKDEAGRLRLLAEYRLTGRPKQVAFRMKILDLSRANWLALGFSSHRAEGIASLPFESCVDIATPERLGKLKAMREDKLLRVLGEPTMVTLDGRNAHFSKGPAGDEQVGRETTLNLLPKLVGADKLILETAMKVRDPFDPFGKKLPVPRACGITTNVQMHFGQTLVLATQAQDRDGESPKTSDSQAVQGAEKAREETVEVILITPELVIPLDPLSPIPGLPGAPAPVPMPRPAAAANSSR
jgi:hypothetical protein